jgi:hypothetical protein
MRGLVAGKYFSRHARLIRSHSCPSYDVRSTKREVPAGAKTRKATSTRSSIIQRVVAGNSRNANFFQRGKAEIGLDFSVAVKNSPWRETCHDEEMY